MPFVERKTIDADIVHKPTHFDLLLTSVVTIGAQRLQLSKPELHLIATVPFNMVDNAGKRLDAFVGAHLTKWLDLQLILRHLEPSRLVIQFRHQIAPRLLRLWIDANAMPAVVSLPGNEMLSFIADEIEFMAFSTNAEQHGATGMTGETIIKLDRLTGLRLIEPQIGAAISIALH
jgi:hypothetical protein